MGGGGGSGSRHLPCGKRGTRGCFPTHPRPTGQPPTQHKGKGWGVGVVLGPWGSSGGTPSPYQAQSFGAPPAHYMQPGPLRQAWSAPPSSWSGPPGQPPSGGKGGKGGKGGTPPIAPVRGGGGANACLYFLSGQPCLLPDCRLFHGERQVCFNFQRGECTRGGSCRFAHQAQARGASGGGLDTPRRGWAGRPPSKQRARSAQVGAGWTPPAGGSTT